MLSRALKFFLAGSAIYLLLFFGLGKVGLLGPDEPRYASIGREMAHSGDWVTPRLWGEPWFEKPALLYWMTGLAFRAGINEDLAPRFPAALVSLAFLIFFFTALRGEFGWRAAIFSTAILATSAAWLGFSEVGTPDLPMSAAFAASMLLVVRWTRKGGSGALIGAGALLGIAVLAKGLVPLVLAIPAIWIARKRFRELLRAWPVIVFLAVTLPWYVLCTMRNGAAFLTDFFWKHHFERFASGALMHEQPFWYYLPILLAALFPWTPLLILLFRRGLYTDERRRFLLLWIAFGLVFFSAATNKLPGYILPLIPAISALAGIALAEGGAGPRPALRPVHIAPIGQAGDLPHFKSARWLLTACALMLALVPFLADALPEILAVGLSRSQIASAWPMRIWPALAVIALAAAVWFARRREVAVALIVAGITASVVFIKIEVFPILDRTVSARQLWREIANERNDACADNLPRNWRYGLNYYSVTPLPDCAEAPRRLQIHKPGEVSGNR